MAHVAIIPLVIAWKADGRQAFVYAGSPLPDDLRDGEIERLLDGKFVEEVPDEVEADEAPVEDETDKPLDTMTSAELDELAAAEGIDLAGAKNKAAKVEAITTAREANASQADDPSNADSTSGL